MERKDFIRHVNALVKPADVILSSLTPQKVNILHAAVGLSGEVAEVFKLQAEWRAAAISKEEYRRQLMEEIGDVIFYFTQLQEAVLYAPKTEGCYEVPSITYIESGIGALVIGAGDILDAAKRLFVYGLAVEQLPVAFDKLFIQFAIGITQVFQHADFGPDEVTDYNYTKLKARYPEGYTDTHAALRLDGAKL